MKVLFAVNSESISDAIIKKYQRDYREILSYKNVYYFNAIQKEIQKDKSYDRIVISADLEPFSNNNYESIDKFIFEKLDGISDEAHDTEGNEISIILICSDRHTKGSSFLVKLFGLGIYNGLLGNDRSMEEVCRLINKPRTKKEAKMYYKIDTDDVNYRTEHENEVDELQIQNILFHFRKLGKNTQKYASSFENIATQYTDEQLKIIINCLPANVKRVLEETSSKYQEIMTASGAMVQGIRSSGISDREDQRRTGLKIDIIENKLNQTKMNGPIVIPNSVKKAGAGNARKVIEVSQKPKDMATMQQNKVEQANHQIKRTTPELKGDKVENKENQPTNEKMVRLPNGKILRKKVVQPEMESRANAQPKTVKPERKAVDIPEKNKTKIVDELEDLDFFTTAAPVKRPARNTVLDEPEVEVVEKPKKGRGRPRKNPIEPEKPKGKRGRPRKNPVEAPVKASQDDFELEELPNLTTNPKVAFDLLEEDNFIPGLKEETENNNFEEFIEDEIVVPTKAPQKVLENQSKEIDLPELDELEDINDFEEEDELTTITEEAFDEFNDYDEYGQYETTSSINTKEEDIDKLYEEDILADANTEFEEDTLPGVDMTEFDDFAEQSESDFEMSAEPEEDNLLLSDFDDAEDILAAVEIPEEESSLELEDNEVLMPEPNVPPVNQMEESKPYVEPPMPNTSMYSSNETTEAIQRIESPIDYSMSNLNSLMTKDKKIVTFLGSTKNGVSFLVNNLAEIFASVGINTAILDMTKNRNSYYIYTQNEEALRQIAYTSIDKLQNGTANGIKVKQNLTVYTALPNDEKDYSNVEAILSTLVQNHSLVLIDCDFETNPAYFASCQEIYLVQSMDILTIQPLTAYLRDLKAQGVFEPEKVRVVINKELKVRGLTGKAIIGGMSSYNDPAMSFMTELFDKESVKYCSIPFEEMAYSKYLEGMLNCKVSLSGYSKNFMNKLRILGDMVYPLTSRQTYSSKTKQNYKPNHFSNSMNDTLNKMKRNY